MILVFYLLLAALMFGKEISGAVLDENQCSKFDYEYKILERIIFLENKNKELEKDQIVLERKNEELVEIVREQRLEMERVVKELEEEMKKVDSNLETEVQNLNATLESRLVEVRSDIDQINKEQSEQKATVKQLGTEMVQKDNAQNEARNLIKSNLQVEDRRLGTTIQGLEANMSTKLEQIKIELSATQQNKIGFFVRLTEPISDNSPKTMVFDKVVTNVGGAYNAATGIFKAPVKGLYLFSANLFVYNRYTRLEILKNKNVVGNLYVDGYRGGESYDQSTHTVIVDLLKGDEVCLKLNHSGGSGSVVYGDAFASFSGVLVK